MRGGEEALFWMVGWLLMLNEVAGSFDSFGDGSAIICRYGTQWCLAMAYLPFGTYLFKPHTSFFINIL